MYVIGNLILSTNTNDERDIISGSIQNFTTRPNNFFLDYTHTRVRVIPYHNSYSSNVNTVFQSQIQSYG